MKGTAIFDRDKLIWRLMSIDLRPDFFMGADKFKRQLTKLGKRRFIHVLDVKLDSFKMTGEERYNWSSSELPTTPTINQCIEQNRNELNRVKSILFNN